MSVKYYKLEKKTRFCPEKICEANFFSRKKTTNNEMSHDLQQLELFSNHSAFDFSFQEPSGLISFVNLNCLICHKLFLMLAF